MKNKKRKRIRNLSIATLISLLAIIIDFLVIAFVIFLVALPLWPLLNWLVPENTMHFSYTDTATITGTIYLSYIIAKIMRKLHKSLKITDKKINRWADRIEEKKRIKAEKNESKIIKTGREHLAKLKDKLKDSGIEFTEDNTDSIK